MATQQPNEVDRRVRGPARRTRSERLLIPNGPRTDRSDDDVEPDDRYAINGKQPRFTESAEVLFRWSNLNWPGAFWP